MVFPTSSPGARSARQFEGFVYVDGQLGHEPGRYQVQCLRKLADVLNGARICNLLLRHGKGTCLDGLAGRLLTASRRAERLSRVEPALDRNRGTRL